jgi:FAD/FMN-containing dehydrogenase
VLLALPFVALLFLIVSVHGDPTPDKLAREAENTKQNIVTDVTELYPVHVQGIIVPHTTEEIVEAVRTHDHVSIGGGRNSMGGETASPRAVQIDMREFNKILNISTTSKEVTVQAGARWRDIQDAIDPYGLSIMIMQTYSNFTVGGSLSVNVHGRYIGLGPIILSVKSFKIVLADGSVIEASPTSHADIFYSAIGGMGGIGVITDVTLKLADNVNVERAQTKINTEDYLAYFNDHVRSNPDVLFENGDMYPPAFKHVSVVTWSKTDRPPTVPGRLIPRKQDYWKERVAWVVMSEWPFGNLIREYILEPYIYAEHLIHTRNYEASYDIAELEPKDRGGSSYVLQEYFVPVERFDEWVPKMKKVFVDNDVNILNVSIRHALPDPGAKLAWARTESFAFVVYYKQGTDEAARQHVGKWTRQMIDEVLSVGGTYYLPYQPWATDDQLHRAYPNAVQYFEIKNAYDPTDKFTNSLWDKYYSPEKLRYYKDKQRIRSVASTTPEYYRPYDNAYLSLPEWYIVYSADEYATVLSDSLPSHFPYSASNREYWRQFNAVTALVADSPHNNDDYITVLQVIGWSFSVENAVKNLYESTLGRLSERLAGNTRVPEDEFAAHAARAYADFIYPYPWYDFPYARYLKDLWRVQADRDYTVGQNIRRVERKSFLTLEYGIKAVYAALIRAATHAKFGVQDDVVYAIISRDGVHSELISAPHYHSFTVRLLEVLDEERLNARFAVEDISGNDSITFTYRDAVGAVPPERVREIMRDTEIVSVIDGTDVLKDRVTVEADVQDLADVYRALARKGIQIDHFYDY